MRIDQLLGERGLATSRSQAQRMIAAGVLWRLDSDAPWKRVAKNGDDVPHSAEVELLDTSEARYVSRGGLKLEGALKATGLQVTGLNCLDIGPVHRRLHRLPAAARRGPCGGRGRGPGPAAPNLREDPRVTCIERVNARELDASDLIA